MKKMVSIITCILVVVLFATSCSGGDYMNNAVEEITDNKIDVSYDEFNGEKEYTLSVKDDANIYFDITTSSGILNVQIYNKGDRTEPICDYNDVSTLMMSVLVEANSEYDIVLSAEKHKGKFLFYSK